MKSLAWIVALFVIAVGVTGIIAPDRLFSLGSIVATPAGLLGIAVIRIAIGIVLIMTASRMPRTLQVIGGVVLLAGLVTPLFGVERTRAVLAWEAAQDTVWLRIGGALAVAIGTFLTFSLTPRMTRG